MANYKGKHRITCYKEDPHAAREDDVFSLSYKGDSWVARTISELGSKMTIFVMFNWILRVAQHDVMGK